MKKSIWTLRAKTTIVISLAELVSVAGCSFQSNQLNFLKGLLQPEEIVSQNSWVLSGVGDNIVVYPMQSDGTILFTEGQSIFLKFDGWHFVEIRGYPAVGVDAVSESWTTVRFDYSATNFGGSDLCVKDCQEENLSDQRANVSEGNDIVSYKVKCADWQRTPFGSGELLRESCYFDGQEGFSNSIWLDQSGNITVIESVIGPNLVKFRVAIQE